ncbi:MAG: hypothetical protein ACE5FT_04180 [Candidatus Nanoarchaeia archaeon]
MASDMYEESFIDRYLPNSWSKKIKGMLLAGGILAMGASTALSQSAPLQPAVPPTRRPSAAQVTPAPTGISYAQLSQAQQNQQSQSNQQPSTQNPQTQQNQPPLVPPSTPNNPVPKRQSPPVQTQKTPLRSGLETIIDDSSHLVRRLASGASTVGSDAKTAGGIALDEVVKFAQQNGPAAEQAVRSSASTAKDYATQGVKDLVSVGIHGVKTGFNLLYDGLKFTGNTAVSVGSAVKRGTVRYGPKIYRGVKAVGNGVLDVIGGVYDVGKTFVKEVYKEAKGPQLITPAPTRHPTQGVTRNIRQQHTVRPNQRVQLPQTPPAQARPAPGTAQTQTARAPIATQSTGWFSGITSTVGGWYNSLARRWKKFTDGNVFVDRTVELIPSSTKPIQAQKPKPEYTFGIRSFTANRNTIDRSIESLTNIDETARFVEAFDMLTGVSQFDSKLDYENIEDNIGGFNYYLNLFPEINIPEEMYGIDTAWPKAKRSLEALRYSLNYNAEGTKRGNQSFDYAGERDRAKEALKRFSHLSKKQKLATLSLQELNKKKASVLQMREAILDNLYQSHDEILEKVGDITKCFSLTPEIQSKFREVRNLYLSKLKKEVAKARKLGVDDETIRLRLLGHEPDDAIARWRGIESDENIAKLFNVDLKTVQSKKKVWSIAHQEYLFNENIDLAKLYGKLADPNSTYTHGNRNDIRVDKFFNYMQNTVQILQIQTDALDAWMSIAKGSTSKLTLTPAITLGVQQDLETIVNSKPFRRRFEFAQQYRASLDALLKANFGEAIWIGDSLLYSQHVLDKAAKHVKGEIETEEPLTAEEKKKFKEQGRIYLSRTVGNYKKRIDSSVRIDPDHKHPLFNPTGRTRYNEHGAYPVYKFLEYMFSQQVDVNEEGRLYLHNVGAELTHLWRTSLPVRRIFRRNWDRSVSKLFGEYKTGQRYNTTPEVQESLINKLVKRSTSRKRAKKLLEEYRIALGAESNPKAQESVIYGLTRRNLNKERAKKLLGEYRDSLRETKHSPTINQNLIQELMFEGMDKDPKLNKEKAEAAYKILHAGRYYLRRLSNKKIDQISRGKIALEFSIDQDGILEALEETLKESEITSDYLEKYPRKYIAEFNREMAITLGMNHLRRMKHIEPKYGKDTTLDGENKSSDLRREWIRGFEVANEQLGAAYKELYAKPIPFLFRSLDEVLNSPLARQFLLKFDPGLLFKLFTVSDLYNTKGNVGQVLVNANWGRYSSAYRFLFKEGPEKIDKIGHTDANNGKKFLATVLDPDIIPRFLNSIDILRYRLMDTKDFFIGGTDEFGKYRLTPKSYFFGPAINIPNKKQAR